MADGEAVVHLLVEVAIRVVPLTASPDPSAPITPPPDLPEPHGAPTGVSWPTSTSPDPPFPGHLDRT